VPLLLATHAQNAEIFSLKKVDANGSTSSSFLLLNTAALHTASSASNFISHNDFRKLQFRQHRKVDCATTIASTTLRFSSRRRRRQKSSSKVVVVVSRAALAQKVVVVATEEEEEEVFFMSLLCVFFSRGKAPSFFLLHFKDDFDALCTPPPLRATPRDRHHHS
tara:strand:- start:61 stop:552 length:492 start_codon:yes stop_codon:yes gene_type:complete